MNKVIQGDCLEKLKELEDNSVDSIVTDPPYHLVSIVKRFGKEGSAPAKEGTDGSFKRLSAGFMGKEWDGVDENGMGIAMNVEMWKECLRVLKPGGHLLAFSGTRTYHRMASAIEDAGFEVRDQIAWCYGQGFPKSLNVFKQLKKKCECGNMEVYENRTQQVGANSEQEAEYFMRFMQESNLSQTKPLGEKQGEVLQSGLSEQGSHSTVLRKESKESSNGGEERILEGGNNLQKTEGELQGSDLPEMSERVFTNGKERRIHNATQVNDGSTPEKIIDENGSGASHRPQSEQQQYREPCAFCKQWGTQATRTLGVGTALKPSIEPICVARKQIEKGLTIAENCLKWGTGGINIDESRVENTGKSTLRPLGKSAYQKGGGIVNGGVAGNREVESEFGGGHEGGRFPANLIHDGSDEVKECFPEQKSGARSSKHEIGNEDGEMFNHGIYGKYKAKNYDDAPAESGNASRFFKGIPQVVDLHDFSIYNRSILTNIKQLCGQHLTKKRIGIMLDGVIQEVEKFIQDAELLMSGNNATTEKFLTDIASITKILIAQMTELKTLNVLPNWLIIKFTEESEQTIKSLKELNTEDVKSAKSIFLLQTFINEVLESIKAIAEIVVEKDLNNGEYKSLVYIPKASKSERNKGMDDLELKEWKQENSPNPNREERPFLPVKNNHPTVKPIALMEYLIKMVTPKGGTVLDPFAGSGSTLVACKQNGFQYIGIEKELEYIKIIEARLKK